MPEPKPSEARSRIIKAAVALFARQGFHGTSTREIARLADVSEVTIFRYFECKDNIFWSALQSSFSAIKPRLKSFGRSSAGETPEIILPEIVSLLVDVATFSPELVRLIAVALLELRGPAEEVCREHLTPPVCRNIYGYSFDCENIESGRVRNLNPCNCYLRYRTDGDCMQPELSKLVGGNPLSQLGGREAISEYSAFWLAALVPASN